MILRSYIEESELGGKPSKAMALDSMLRNFKKDFSGDYMIKLPSGKFHALSKKEWPSFVPK